MSLGQQNPIRSDNALKYAQRRCVSVPPDRIIVSQELRGDALGWLHKGCRSGVAPSVGGRSGGFRELWILV